MATYLGRTTQGRLYLWCDKCEQSLNLPKDLDETQIEQASEGYDDAHQDCTEVEAAP
jgi:hypothetical protein